MCSSLLQSDGCLMDLLIDTAENGSFKVATSGPISGIRSIATLSCSLARSQRTVFRPQLPRVGLQLTSARGAASHSACCFRWTPSRSSSSSPRLLRADLNVPQIYASIFLDSKRGVQGVLKNNTCDFDKNPKYMFCNKILPHLLRTNAPLYPKTDIVCNSLQ